MNSYQLHKGFGRFGFSGKTTNRLERIWLLSVSDFKQNYAETYLGFFWTMITPLFRLSIYFIVFSTFFVKDIPNYGLHIYSGLVVWIFFNEATKKSMGIIKSKGYLIENVNVDVKDLYVSGLTTSFLLFLTNLVVYLVISQFFDIAVNWTIILAFIQIVILLILILGVNLILSNIHIIFRDIRKLWEMALVLLFWMNPIFYSKAKVLESIPVLIYINPLAGIITNTRNAILMGELPDWNLLMYDLAYALIVLSIGLLLNKKLNHLSIEKL